MPPYRTHDISSTYHHVKDIKAFGDILDEAATAAFPNRGLARYKEVHVLLLSWEDDNLGVINEVVELDDVFRNTYHYQTETWKIPSTRSHNSLAAKIVKFLDDYESQDNLLITYYGGHGEMNDDRQCVWLWSVQPWLTVTPYLRSLPCARTEHRFRCIPFLSSAHGRVGLLTRQCYTIAYNIYKDITIASIKYRSQDHFTYLITRTSYQTSFLDPVHRADSCRSTGARDSPEVQWYALQTMLEQAKSDVLILLDCCAAASSATGSGNGITEIVAACGFETWAPGVGR